MRLSPVAVIAAFFSIGNVEARSGRFFNILFRREASCPRCGVLFSAVHRTDALGTCVDRCAMREKVALDDGWSCGRCPVVTEAPTLSPSDMPSDVPSQVPSDMPSSVPTTIDSSKFNIDVVGLGIDPMDEAFQSAASRWEQVLTEDIPAVSTLVLEKSVCNVLPDEIDDLLVCPGTLGDELADGPGKLIALVGVEWQRYDTGFPIIGRMDFDVDDVGSLENNGEFEDVVVYSVGLILGISQSVWEHKKITDNCFYDSNLEASVEFQTLAGCPDASIPLDVGCSHWDSKCIPGEVMNGNFNGGAISRMSVGALKDIGYEVDFDAADPYDASNLDAQCLEDLCPTSVRRLRVEQQRVGAMMKDKARRELLTQGSSVENIKKSLAELAKKRPVEHESSNAVYVADQTVFALYRNPIDRSIFSILVTS